MTDVAKLVRQAREWAQRIDSKPTEEWIRGYVLDGINYAESLCDALEEMEQHAQVWRQNFSNANEYIARLEAQLEEREAKLGNLEREVERLRLFLKKSTMHYIQGPRNGLRAYQDAKRHGILEREGGR